MVLQEVAPSVGADRPSCITTFVGPFLSNVIENFVGNVVENFVGNVVENFVKNVVRSPIRPPSSTKPNHAMLALHRLRVYQRLDFMRWFVQLPGGIELSDRVCREVDKAGTGMILNIAEGNGRYSTLDHRRFVDMASASAVKAGVYLDLLGEKAEGGTVDVTAGRVLLGRILAMLAGF